MNITDVFLIRLRARKDIFNLYVVVELGPRS